MLLENGKEFALTSAQMKELESVIGGKWPVTIRWVPEKIRKSSKNKGIPEQPAATIIALTWPAAIDKKNAEGKMVPTRGIITYCENISIVHEGEKTKITYIPNDIYFTGNSTFEQKDTELVWYLWYCYPSFRGGKNNTSSKATDEIMFDLPQLVHEANILYETNLNEAKNIILDRNNSDAYLRTVAQAFFISGTENMRRADIQNSLIGFVNKGVNMKQKLANIESFMIIAGNKELVRARAIVQSALDNNLIIWIPERRAVCMLEEGKPMNTPICIAPANVDWKEHLYEISVGTKEGQDNLKVIEATLDALTKVKAVKEPTKVDHE